MHQETKLLRWVFGAALLFAAGAFAYVLSRPLERLVVIVPDDAFYYLTVARNLALGRGSTFDGLNPTNGYHPGWMALLALSARLFQGPVELLRTGLVLGFVLHVAASLCLAAALGRWTTRAFGLAAGALWLLNPTAVNLALQCMEAALYVFALALAFWIYTSRIEPPTSLGRAPPDRDLVWFGASLGLCFLARTEASILVATVGAALTWGFRRSGAIRRGALVAGSAALVVAPWFVYSRLATGAWSQRSGAMKLLWAAHDPAPLLERLWDGTLYVLGAWVTYPILGVPGGSFIGVRALGGALITAVLVALVWRGFRAADTRRAAAVAATLLGGSLLTGLFYAAFFSEMQYWYKAQPGFVFYVVLFGASALVIRRRMPKLAGPALAAAWLVSAAALVVRLATLNSYPHQRDVWRSQPRFDAMVPKGDLIGCFNAGIPGYFSSRTIVNLDGLVNNTVYDYYGRRDFDGYLRDAHIRYIADETEAVERGFEFTRQRPVLETIASVPMPDWLSGRRYLWRVELAAGSKANGITEAARPAPAAMDPAPGR